MTAYLDWHRTTLLMKIDGVSDEDLRRPLVPSGTNLLGLVKHLAYVEQSWFQRTFLGLDVKRVKTEEDPDAEFRIEPHEATQDVIDLYKGECQKSREITDAASLDDVAKRTEFPPNEPRRGFTLRWILVHMIEETARHNGHADILRELIDGATGD